MIDCAEIVILCENQGQAGRQGKNFIGQYGLSLFVRAEKDVLFDTGPSDIFKHNAALLGIDLVRIKNIVLSHGHWDHANGIMYLPVNKNPQKLVAHPGIFTNRYGSTGCYNGMKTSREELAERFDLYLSKEPVALTESLFFLGEIPRRNNFESLTTSFFYKEGGQTRPDFIMDDSALVLVTTKGCVVISGCAHAGICNICEHAMAVTGQSHLHMVLGGFHILEAGEQLERTILYFKETSVDMVFPLHCTAQVALDRFYQEFKSPKLCCGDIIRIEQD